MAEHGPMKVITIGATGLITGVALAMLAQNGQPASRGVSLSSPLAGAAAGDATGSLEQRVAELERALSIEREARQWLEDEIFLMAGELPAATPEKEGSSSDARDDVAPGQRRDRRDGGRSREYRVSRMVEAGIDHAKAEWILQRESELQFEALQIRYEAGRNGTINDFYTTRTDLRSMLREEIGDADYERYLQANGMATDVVISYVLDASPARAAGLRPGDRITRYNGQRVFSMGDMTQQIMRGTPGENIVLEFERDGIPMQVLLPRGPVGVSGGSG